VLEAQQPALSVEPVSLNFGYTNTQQTIAITNAGVSNLPWSVSADSAWLTAAPTSGAATTEQDLVTVSVSRTGLSGGSHTGRLTVTSAGSLNSPVTVEVVARVATAATPHLRVTPGTVDLGLWGVTGSVTLANDGTESLGWSVSSDCAWLTAMPASGTLTTNTQDVTVRVERNGLAAGVSTGHVIFASADADNSPQVVTVTLTELPAVLHYDDFNDGVVDPAWTAVDIGNTRHRDRSWRKVAC